MTAAPSIAYLVALRAALPVALRVSSVRTVLDGVERSTRWLAPAPAAVAASERWAARLRLPNTCLYRAIVRWAVLTRSGAPARLVLGVRRDAPETGHAWVEVDGRPHGEERDARLVTTFSYPG